MSGIAELLANLGYVVSGSDEKRSATTDRLVTLGIRVEVGHDAAHVGDADVVVISSAVRPSNPEVVEAGATGLLVPARDPEALGQAIAALLAPTIATRIQSSVSASGRPFGRLCDASRTLISANGSAKIVCSNFIMSRIMRVRMTIAFISNSP